MIKPASQAKAIAAIEAAIGSANVSHGAAALARFGPAKVRPAAVAMPASVEQLGQLVAAASAAGGVLQPVCNGDGPLGRQVVPGAIVVDLKRMNKIIEVNSELAYCLVEPGVTYRQLADYLKANNHKLWIDLPGSPDESIAASYIERQAGYTAYADHHLMQCGLEVMLADGRLVRTGMGAMPKSSCWQLFKFGYGPWVDGLFTQSDFAVVTKIGMWMMPQPPGYQPFMVTVPREADLEPLFNLLGPLKTNMIVPNGVAVASALHEAALLGKTRRDFAGSGAMAASAVTSAASALGIGYWNLYGSLYGLPDNVAMAWQMVRGAFSSLPGAKVYTAADRPGDRLWAWREGMMRGAVADAPGAVVGWGGGSSLALHPMSPVDGGEAMKLYSLSRAVMARHGFDYVGESNAVWRSTNHHQLLLHSPPRAAHARQCAAELIAAQAAAGFGQIAADPALRTNAEATYGGGLPILRGRLKQALDPRGLFTTV